MIIALEGIDASGKATQTRLLAETLGAAQFSFPDYETPMGQIIKEHLNGVWGAEPADRTVLLTTTSREDSKWRDSMVLQACMLANRMERVVELAKAAEHGTVVCDRYWGSAYAYGQADGIDGQYLWDIHQWLPPPQINILLVVDINEAVKRQIARGRPADRYERNKPLLNEVQENYLQLWGKGMDSGRGKWLIVEGNRSVEAVQGDINKLLGPDR